MKLLFTNIAKKAFIAFMLLSLSMSALSFQNDTVIFQDPNTINISHFIDDIDTVMDVRYESDHCNNTSSSQHCNNCTHCVVVSMTQQVIAHSLFTSVNSVTLFYSEKRIEIPFKPPRI